MSWEQDFSPRPDIATCDHCGQKHIADASIKKTVFVGRDATETYTFCSTNCSHEFFLARLRRLQDDWP
jgi:hypothetical protein